MVTKWGLSDRLGTLTYAEEDGEVFLGRSVTQHKQVSDVTAHVIDEEIRILIQALQCGIGEDFDIAKLRYGRVIIMTDADVDGSHIRTLLLTFLFRQMPELVRQSKVFIAQPPLYQVLRAKKATYVLNDRRMTDALVDLALSHATFAVRDEAGAVVHRVSGDEIRRMVRSLDRLDELVTVSQRRGIPFTKLLASRAKDPTAKNRLPSWHLAWAEGDELFFDEPFEHLYMNM